MILANIDDLSFWYLLLGAIAVGITFIVGFIFFITVLFSGVNNTLDRQAQWERQRGSTSGSRR